MENIVEEMVWRYNVALPKQAIFADGLVRNLHSQPHSLRIRMFGLRIMWLIL